MKLYVTRHGESEYNYENRVSGLRDVDLTKRGMEQAQELAEKLKDCKIGVIFSSPLKRAKKTADAAAKLLGLDVKVDDRLLEHNYGVYEGGPSDNADFRAAKKNFARRIPEGESIFMIVQRVYNFLDELRMNCPKQNVLIVSHMGVCMVVNSYFNDLTDDEFLRYRLRNCELDCFETK